MTISRWKCKDDRYLVRRKDTTEWGADLKNAQCLWYSNYSYNPSNLECVLRYCNNPTTAPNTNSLNFNFVWSGSRVLLGGSLAYPCQSNHKIEEDKEYKSSARSQISIGCGQNGEFIYPDPWPQCSETIKCLDPGNSTEVTRTLKSGDNLMYLSTLEYTCSDPRKWIRSIGTQALSSSATTKCRWRKTYPLDGTNLECLIHHCRHPHDEPGSHPPPAPEYQLILKEKTSWTVSFGNNVKYECEDGTWIENEEIDRTENSIDVECLTDVGEYNTPVRQGETWPNCTETVVCGVPPDPPVNGSRTWLNGAEENQMTYDTSILYHCEDGSQFDTDDDGLGDSVTVEIRCQWNKVWFPYLELPPCIITHCVEPFKIPDETNLEEITSDWTPINENKQYQCKNTVDSVYTMFWESDRSKSTFEIVCKDDGYFTWKEWPICLTDVICSPDPPEIPTHTEYTLIKDDGTVTINGLTYPTYPQEIKISNVWNSSMNNKFIAKNYMANLTYDCGSAREFFYDDDSQSKTQSMTCQWDRTWTPQVELGECDWVACLKPPPTPVSTHLKVTDWFGEPIPFGEQIRYVCERGYQFEDDPSQIDVFFTCQDGSNEEHKDKRGFFDVPGSEEGWPKCVLGILVNFS